MDTLEFGKLFTVINNQCFVPVLRITGETLVIVMIRIPALDVVVCNFAPRLVPIFSLTHNRPPLTINRYHSEFLSAHFFYDRIKKNFDFENYLYKGWGCWGFVVHGLFLCASNSKDFRC